MASKNLTFDPDAGVPYAANLTIYNGSNFSATYNVTDTSNSAFDFSGSIRDTILLPEILFLLNHNKVGSIRLADIPAIDFINDLREDCLFIDISYSFLPTVTCV